MIRAAPATDLQRLQALRAAYAPVAARDEALMAVLRRLNDQIDCLKAASGHRATD